MKLLQSDSRGLFPIYKPKGPTSHDMIYRIRRLTGEKRVGHAGTLDPLAEGVLIVGISREFTKQLGTHLKKEKEYIATVKLGETSTTDDAEGEKTVVKSLKSLNLLTIKEALTQFTGEIWQTPPVYSSIKVHGQTAHSLVRKGRVVVLEPRLREVKEIEVLEYEWPIVRLRVTTGSGVYIRSLARDLGEKLGTGGYLAGLIRTRVGAFTLDDCYHVSDDRA